MAHREGIREYLKDVQVHGLVYDWGCGTKPIKKYLKPNEARFFTIDKHSYLEPDLVANIEREAVQLPEPADFAFCLEVIEHIWDDITMLANISVNLKEGGVLYLSQPFMYEVHKEDDRKRYTYHGLKKLLTDTGFTVEEIVPTVGDLDHAEGYVLRATK